MSYDFHTLNDLVGEEFGLSEEDYEKRMPSGKKSFNHRMHWTLYHLRRARFVEDTDDGKLRITEDGKKALRSKDFYKGDKVNWAYLESIPGYRGDPKIQTVRKIRAEPIEEDDLTIDDEMTFDEYIRRIRVLDEKGSEGLESREVTTSQKKRSQELAKLVRRYRGDECQICGDSYDSEEGTFCDSHHIVPLAEGGTDTSDNIIIVCPSCHRRFHLSEVELIEGEKSKAVKVPWIDDRQEIEYWQNYD